MTTLELTATSRIKYLCYFTEHIMADTTPSIHKNPIHLLAEEYRGRPQCVDFSLSLLLSTRLSEMNGTHVEVLLEPPSALEFARLVHISRPVLIERAVLLHWLYLQGYGNLSISQNSSFPLTDFGQTNIWSRNWGRNLFLSP